MTRPLIASLGLFLAACGGSGTTPGGAIAASFSHTALSGDVIFIEGATTYSYAVGTNAANTALAAEAWLTTPSTLPNPPNTGTAVLTGTYKLVTSENPVLVGGELRGTTNNRPLRPITLTADFASQSLTGAADGLSINGSFGTTGELAGTATFGAFSGSLSGDVGPASAIGAFYGDSANGVFAGGFIVED